MAITKSKKSSKTILLALISLVGGLSFFFIGATDRFIDNNVSVCESSETVEEAAACACIKSEPQTSLMIAKAFLGYGEQFETVIRRCKGL